MLSKGANVNARNKYGGTPLVATTVGIGDSPEVAKLLIIHGAKVNSRMEDGATALHRAVMNGQPEVLRVLLLEGADTTIKNDMGQTALDLALIYKETKFRRDSAMAKREKQFEACAEILREHGAE